MLGKGLRENPQPFEKLALNEASEPAGFSLVLGAESLTLESGGIFGVFRLTASEGDEKWLWLTLAENASIARRRTTAVGMHSTPPITRTRVGDQIPVVRLKSGESVSHFQGT